jgi:hypothetical protein
MKWDKDGTYQFLGIATHAETGEHMIIYREGLGMKTAPFDSASFSLKGKPRNAMFDFIESEPLSFSVLSVSLW